MAPDVDSPDLSDEEIAKAIPTGSPEAVAEHLKACPTCGAQGGKSNWKKLKRGPHYYSRVTLKCPEGHETTQLFEMTWCMRRP
jgi:hypothetical protein